MRRVGPRSVELGALPLSSATLLIGLVMSIFLLSGCSMGVSDSVVPPIVTNKVPDATAVGSETCSDCHSTEPDFYLAGHHRAAFFQEEESAGCESCHGNGSVHVEFFY